MTQEQMVEELRSEISQQILFVPCFLWISPSVLEMTLALLSSYVKKNVLKQCLNSKIKIHIISGMYKALYECRKSAFLLNVDDLCCFFQGRHQEID